MTEELDLDIRYTRPMDGSYLKEWIMHPEVLSYFPMSDEKEVGDAVSCWISFSKYQCSLTATIDHIPCAVATLFLMPYKKVSHHCSFKICVDPKRFRRGIGFSLLKNLKHLAKTYFHLEEIYIEVFGDNPLIHLLKKFDFYEFAKQEKYVKVEGKYLPRTCFICKIGKEGES